MSEGRYLLNLSIGPVQSFIAAARRTRDLWFGSMLLSEVSLAAAKSVRDAGGMLIFPNPESLESGKGEDAPNVANVILAELPEGLIPGDVAQKARVAANAGWRDRADSVFDDDDCRKIINEEIWKSQVGDVLEFFAAWTPIENGDYGAARDRVTSLMAARKNCRNFRQPELPADRRRLEKSSLDGRNETVLVDGVQEKLSTGLKMKLRLKENEYLDAVGLVKRAAERRAFPSVDRIAADPWLLHVKDRYSDEYKKLRETCSKIEGIGGVPKDLYPYFPFEGSVVYLSRYESLKEEAHLDLSPVKEIVSDLVHKGKAGEPSPYLAILKADGDRMGKAISAIRDAEEHRAFSKALAEFAAEARVIIKDYRGACVYTGGDDVLAFLPLDTCLACARALWQKFGKLMGKWKCEGGNKPTLSVGIAIGHFLEPLEDLLRFADEAETVAKKSSEKGGDDDRNGLAVIVRSRGNAPIAVRAQWNEKDGQYPLDERITFWRDLFLADNIPSRFPYELRVLAESYRNWDADLCAEALPVDVRRVFDRKDIRLDEPADKERIEKQIAGIKTVDDLRALVSEMLAAGNIARALPVGYVGEARK